MNPPPQFYLSNAIAMTTRDIYAPKKTVIVDMVMVQILAIMVTLCLVLITGSQTLSSDTIAYMMAGLMVSVLMAGAIYSRISGM